MAQISEMWQTMVTWPQSLFSVVSDLLICETWDFLAIVKEQNRWSPKEWVADSEAEERKDCVVAGSLSFRISGLSSLLPRVRLKARPACSAVWTVHGEIPLKGESDPLRGAWVPAGTIPSEFSL